MEIIFQGNHGSDEAAESLLNVIKMFSERYKIHHFREMHLTVTLVDESGDDVELVDNETKQTYRTFEVYKEGNELTRRPGLPVLKLVVDNT
jgi:hypothetical protein